MAEKKLGKYKVLSVVGAGSMGIVYRGEDPELGRPVALKTLYKITPTATTSIEVIIEKIRHEARLAGNLRHPNIVRIYEVSSESGTPFIVMDLFEGEPLDLLIKNRGQLAPELVLRIVEQVASALDYAHSQGVIHRDVKPANILVDSSQRVAIVDFGVAAILDILPDSEGGQIGARLPIVGSAGYMAPEQIKGELITARADIFCLAIVTFECLTGVRPFTGETAPVVMESIKHALPTPICSLRPSLDLAVQEIFARALSKEVASRFATAQEFVEALRPYLSAAETAKDDGVVYQSRLPKVKASAGAREEAKGAAVTSGAERVRTPSPASAAIQIRLESAVRRVRIVSLVLVVTCLGALCMALWSVFHYSSEEAQKLTIIVDPGGDVALFSNERILALIAQRSSSDPARTHELLVEATKRHLNSVASLIPRYLRSDEPQLVIDAIAGCTEFTQLNCKSVIVSLLGDPNREIRLAAVRHLRNNGARGALSAQLMKEHDPEVEQAIREALGAL